MSNNRHVRRILSEERFDAVFFSLFDFNTEHFSADPAQETSILTGAESLYRQIVARGARPYLYWGYATRDNPHDTARIAEGVTRVRSHLDALAALEGTPARLIHTFVTGADPAASWVEVREWTGVGDARLVFDLGEYPAADEDDAAILEHALAALDALERWNREDDRSCDDAGSVSLFCLLQRSVRWRMGRYHHRQPALEIVRLILREGWPERLGSHPVMDFNNHPSTTRDDLRQLLRSALQRVHRELDHAARES